MKWKGFRPSYVIRQELHLTMWQRIKRVFFVGTLFYFAQNKHTVFMQFSQIEKIR